MLFPHGSGGGIKAVLPYFDIPTHSALPTLVNFDSTVTATEKSAAFFNGCWLSSSDNWGTKRKAVGELLQKSAGGVGDDAGEVNESRHFGLIRWASKAAMRRLPSATSSRVMLSATNAHAASELR